MVVNLGRIIQPTTNSDSVSFRAPNQSYLNADVIGTDSQSVSFCTVATKYSWQIASYYFMRL